MRITGWLSYCEQEGLTHPDLVMQLYKLFGSALILRQRRKGQLEDSSSSKRKACSQKLTGSDVFSRRY